MTNIPTEIDLFKNDFLVRIFQIIVSFIGVFVIVFTIFVITYIYMKCCRTTTNEVETEGHKEAQYKALSLSAVEPESERQLGHQQQESIDCNYLTPVFKDSANSDDCRSDENVGIFRETTIKLQQNRHKPANDSNLTPDPESTNIYIEIIEDNI